MSRCPVESGTSRRTISCQLPRALDCVSESGTIENKSCEDPKFHDSYNDTYLFFFIYKICHNFVSDVMMRKKYIEIFFDVLEQFFLKMENGLGSSYRFAFLRTGGGCSWSVFLVFGGEESPQHWSSPANHRATLIFGERGRRETLGLCCPGLCALKGGGT